MTAQPKFVALDSGNQLIDNGRRMTVKGWRRRARIKMHAHLKRVCFEAFAVICTPWVTGCKFTYVRMAYGKK